MSPKFLYFDLGKVLLDFDHPKMCQQIADLFGIAAPDLEKIVMPTSGTPADPLWKFECGLIREEVFFDWLCGQLKSKAKSIPNHDQLAGAMSTIFTPMDDSLDLVKSLHKAGHRLGILSNTNCVHWRYIMDGRYPILNDCFEQPVASFQLLCMKPEKAIYRAAAKAADLTMEELFFVDDKPTNVEGAKECGLDAVLYESHEKLVEDLKAREIDF